jgi:hypothetical protein
VADAKFKSKLDAYMSSKDGIVIGARVTGRDWTGVIESFTANTYETNDGIRHAVVRDDELQLLDIPVSELTIVNKE